MHITCTNGKTPIVWITRKSKNTQLTNGTDVEVRGIEPGELCLFTVMQMIEANGAQQICPVSSMTVKFEKLADGASSEIVEKTITCKCCTFVFKLNGVTVNEEHCIAEQMAASAKGANEFFPKWLASSKFSFNSHMAQMICNPTMMEPDHTFNGQYNSVSALTGWPQTGRLTLDAIHFARAVTYACIVLGADVPHLLTCDHLPDNIADVLIATTLTSFAGNYPKIPEIVDDRCLGVLKLGLNRDCDDMAISVVAVFNYLQKVDMGAFCAGMKALTEVDPNVCMLGCKILGNMKKRFAHAAAVICQAMPHVAVPGNPEDHNGALIGHVFAVISPNEDLTHCLLVESTRMSSPSNLAIPAYHLGGRQVFLRKTVYETGQPGIQSVKPFNACQYPECIAAYTPDSSYVLHSRDNVIGVPIEDLISGAARAHKITGVPEEARYPRVCRTMAHKPAYAMVDAACAKYGWTDMLAGNQPVQHLTTPGIGEWMATGDYPVKRLGVSACASYAFVTSAGVCAEME